MKQHTVKLSNWKLVHLQTYKYYLVPLNLFVPKIFPTALKMNKCKRVYMSYNIIVPFVPPILEFNFLDEVVT